MKFVSLFTGMGGFDLGLERAGMKCTLQVEINRNCRRVLEHHWPDVKRMKNVEKTKGRFRADLICGGFPCQDLSVAGKRAGLAGKRSGLFFEFARIIAKTSPRWILVENVPGLLSSNGGRDMGTVLGTLGQLGYGWAYRVLDAQYFGVAQRRRRVFIVGHLGDAARPAAVLFKPESLSRDSPPGQETEQTTAEKSGNSTVGSLAARDFKGVGTQYVNEGKVIAAPLTAGSAIGRGVSKPGRRREDDENLIVTHALRAEGHDASEDGTGRGIPLVTAFHVTQDPIHGVISPALSSGNKQGCGTVGLSDGKCVRRLTPLECLRLQGFPDDWLDLDPPLSDSAKYFMTGNAVCVPVAEWIASRIIKVENGELP